MYGKNAPTYESGSLRKFQHGRTDVIRSCTSASDRYCRAVLANPPVAVAQKAKLLREAVSAHKQYINWVSIILCDSITYCIEYAFFHTCVLLYFIRHVKATKQWYLFYFCSKCT